MVPGNDENGRCALELPHVRSRSLVLAMPCSQRQVAGDDDGPRLEVGYQRLHRVDLVKVDGLPEMRVGQMHDAERHAA